jgi:hypothetical protein
MIVIRYGDGEMPMPIQTRRAMGEQDVKLKNGECQLIQTRESMTASRRDDLQTRQ